MTERQKYKKTKNVAMVKYLMKSASMRYCGSGVISHKICKHEIYEI